ncbi:MAG: cupredoxin domain-containing protein [Actinomycetota bacterium]
MKAWSRWRMIVLVASVALVASACTSEPEPADPAAGSSPDGDTATAVGTDVTVRQEEGSTVYWILPGKRRLSPEVFGTPANPLRTGEHRIQQASGDVRELLEQLPLLVGIPQEARETDEEGQRFTTTKMPVPVGDEGRIVEGSFSVTYGDRQPYDWPGDPFETDDEIEAAASFTDPAGDEYEVVVDRLFQPPIPAWETGGGVRTDSWIHGTTGTDSPLFPTAFAYGAFWAVGDVLKNGEVVDENKWVHFMTTQTVRDKDYRLAINEELPLSAGETIAGKLHHTHVIVRPIEIADDGSMSFDPVNTGFELPNGMTQPYLHLMYEQEELIRDGFKDWVPPQRPETAETPAAQADAVEIVVSAEEFSFVPDDLEAQPGEPVRIVLRNEGELAHNLTIGELDVGSETISPGESVEVTFTPEASGELTFFCRVPGHRDAGMEGTLAVQG